MAFYFLDELPEFDRRALEVLREPLEAGSIHIARANRRITFPAKFQLIAAMNPCPCGYLGHTSGKCRCTPQQVKRYRSKISGPLLDRIDLIAEVPSVPSSVMDHPQAPESSQTVGQRVLMAHECQMTRQNKINSLLSNTELDKLACIHQDAKDILAMLMERMNLSARGYYRVLRVARTVADLASEKEVRKDHILRAIPFRRALATST